MSRDDDREGPDPRRSRGGTPVLLVLLLVGGSVALLLVLAVVGAGFLFMARAEQAEMQMVVADERAMAAEELARGGPTRTYSREDFKALVDGKTEQEVEDALGKPARIEQDGPTSHWYYEKRTVGVALDPTVKVTFEAGRVTAITYTPADQ